MKKLFIAIAMACLTGNAMAQLPVPENESMADRMAREQYEAFIAGFGDEYKRLMELNDAFYKTTNRDSVDALMRPLAQRLITLQSEYMKNLPSTCMTAMLMEQNIAHMTVEQMKDAYGKFDELAKQTKGGQALLKEIRTIEKVAPGSPAPEIAKQDFVTKKPFSLSSLKGKVVLLDFWASWCMPCRKSNPHVKELYEKYHKKGFEVVYVADNDKNPEEALKAIKQDGIEKYYHVLRGLKEKKDASGQMIGYDNSEDISDAYAVHFLPTKYLIDRDGNLIGKEGDFNLDEKLKEIFGF